MAVGIVEIDAAAAIKMIDLARALAAEVRVMLDAVGADAGQRRVELALANQKGVVLRAKALGVGKIEGDAVFRLDRYEVSPFRSRLQVQDVGEELGGGPFVLCRDDRVVQCNTHLFLSFLQAA
jgi:hypothetical protein